MFMYKGRRVNTIFGQTSLCTIIVHVNYTLQKKKRIRCFMYFNTCTLNPHFSVTLIDIDSECFFIVKLTVHSSMISV